jgi:hypothetical protein
VRGFGRRRGTRNGISQPSETDSYTSRLTRTKSSYVVITGKMGEKLFSHVGRKRNERTKNTIVRLPTR